MGPVGEAPCGMRKMWVRVVSCLNGKTPLNAARGLQNGRVSHSCWSAGRSTFARCNSQTWDTFCVQFLAAWGTRRLLGAYAGTLHITIPLTLLMRLRRVNIQNVLNAGCRPTQALWVTVTRELRLARLVRHDGTSTWRRMPQRCP